jgi:hypothetical protein
VKWQARLKIDNLENRKGVPSIAKIIVDGVIIDIIILFLLVFDG